MCLAQQVTHSPFLTFLILLSHRHRQHQQVHMKSMISISIKCGRNYPPKRSHYDNDTGNDDNGVHFWSMQDEDDDANDDNEEGDKENDDKML